MAYVVARPNARFEIRESVHTPKGPRARSLANFAILTNAVVAAARTRATRPFNAEALRTAAVRVGAQVEIPETSDGSAMRRFVESSRQMATTLEQPPSGPRRDPGEALLELLGFADQIARALAPREPEPLTFPPLAELAARTTERLAERTAATGPAA